MVGIAPVGIGVQQRSGPGEACLQARRWHTTAVGQETTGVGLPQPKASDQRVGTDKPTGVVFHTNRQVVQPPPVDMQQLRQTPHVACPCRDCVARFVSALGVGVHCRYGCSGCRDAESAQMTAQHSTAVTARVL